MKPHDPGEQVREKPLCIPQEGAFALHAPQLLQQGEGQDFGVRKPLYGLVASSAVGVEMSVGVVYEAEEDDQGFFRVGEAWGMVCVGHLFLLGEGRL
jgi:hypothetical protein